MKENIPGGWRLWSIILMQQTPATAGFDFSRCVWSLLNQLALDKVDVQQICTLLFSR